MTKACPICDIDFRDGDDVVAVVLAKFRLIDSDVAYAVEPSTRCIELVHSSCYDCEYADDGHECDDEKGTN